MRKIIIVTIAILFCMSFFTPAAFSEATTHVINYGGLIYVNSPIYEAGDELLIKTTDAVIITGTKNLRITVDAASSDITLDNFTSEVAECALKYLRGTNTLRLSGANILKSGTYHEGIRILRGSIMMIYEVPGTNGSLEVSGGLYAPGIGASGGVSGHVMIFNGNIIAKGGYNGAGIGSGLDAHNSTVEIFGGKITAKGAGNGAGIGGGFAGDAGTVIIYNGEVIATGGDAGGPGIGGYGGLVFLMQNGTLTATGCGNGAGIGGALCTDGGQISILGGTVIATGGIDGAAGIGGGSGFGGEDSAGGAGGIIKISGGNVTAKGGSDGTLPSTHGGAGIGGGSYSINGGDITIEGGEISAKGASNGAGIGGGSNSKGGTIRIKGGTVTARGGRDSAGIGGGRNRSAGDVTVTGGIILATGGDSAPGIGCGNWGSSGTVKISGGEIYAQGTGWADDIGGGIASGDDITFEISGNSAVFTKRDHSVNPVFTDSPVLHGFLDHYVLTDGSAYGYENFPSSWNGGTAYGWCAPCYTVAFDANAGGATVSGMPDDDYFQRDNKVIKPENPVRDGYKLEGWYKESSCVNKWIFLSDTITSDLTLYANWETNQKPNRIDGVPETETATVRVGTTSEIDLLTIFEDADGDTLSYEVSIDGGENVSAARSYIYTPAEVGVKTLVFVAYDGAVYSDDTYTITITAVGEHTLTYLAGDNGSISGSSPQTVWYGENGTAVEAVADTGYHFVKWSDESTDNPRRDKNVTADIEVTALFEMSTYSLEYIAGANGSLLGDTSQSVNHGENGTAVEAVAATGYNFVKWSDGSTDNPRTDENVEDNISVTAQFAINTYSLEYIAGANGSLLGDTSQSVNHGENGTAVEAVAATGYNFVKWSDGSIDNPRTDENVEDNISVTAQFAINTYSLEYIAGANGTLNGDTSQSVNHGENGTAVEAVAATGYNFVKWSDGATDNPRTDENVEDNISVTAQFAINTYSLEYIAGANGTLNGDTSQSVNHGENGTAVEAVPDTGYHFTGWSDGSTDNPRTDENVEANISVTAQFEINTYSLEYIAGANGSLLGDTSQSVNHGENGTAVEAVAATGYNFVKWSDGATDNPRTDENVEDNISVTAQFAINTYSLEYIAGANGSLLGDTTQSVNHGGDGNSVEAVAATGYHFAGWSDGSTDNPRMDIYVTANIAVTAQFEINTYTLEYMAGANGSLLGDTTQSVNHGGDGNSVEAVAATGYHFAGWSDGSTDNPRTDIYVTANIAVTAQFEVNAYTLEYIAGVNGSLLGDTTQSVNHGGSGTQVDAVPDTGYHFTGWSDIETNNPRTDENVTGDISVTAEFAIDVYQAEYKAGDGGIIDGKAIQQVEYGRDTEKVEAVPDTGYHFVVWSDGATEAARVDESVAGDINVTAEFAANYYDVVFKDYDGAVLKSVIVKHGDIAAPPDDPSHAGYTFAGWDKPFDNVTSDLSITAQYYVRYYKVDFMDYDNHVINSQYVAYGDSALAPADPEREGYLFAGWDTDYTNVQSNLLVYAKYIRQNYTVEFIDYEGSLLKSQTVQYGEDAEAPELVEREGYEFTGWDLPYENVQSDLRVTAQYKELPGEEVTEAIKVSDAQQNDNGDITITIELEDIKIERVEISEGLAVINDDGSLSVTFDKNVEPGDKTVIMHLQDGTTVTKIITIPEPEVPFAPATVENEQLQKPVWKWIWIALIILLGIVFVLLLIAMHRRSRNYNSK